MPQSLSSQDIAVRKKFFFLSFRRSGATLAPFVRVPPYKIRRFWPVQWSPDQTESLLPWKTVSNVPNIQKLPYFPPIDCFGYTRLREVGADYSSSREKSKNRKKSDKIGFDFLLDFLAKMQKCYKMPKCLHFGSGSCIRIFSFKNAYNSGTRGPT